MVIHRLLMSISIIMVSYTSLNYCSVQVDFEQKIDEYYRENKAVLPQGVIKSLKKIPSQSLEADVIKVTEIPDLTDQPLFQAIAFGKLSGLVVKEFRKELLRIITLLDASKHYWEEHKARRLALYFQKSDEIDDKIKKVNNALGIQLELLGSLTLHCDNFTEQVSPQEQLVWIQELCSLILGTDTKKKKNRVKNDISNMLVESARLIKNYAALIQKEMKPYLMPGLLQQYWLKWIGATIVAAYCLKKIYSNRKEIEKKVQNGHDNLKDYAQVQYHIVREALFGTQDISVEKLQKEEALLKRDYQEVLLKLHTELAKQEQDMNYSSVLHPAYHACKKEFADFNPDVINIAAANLDLGYLETVVWPLLSRLTGEEGKNIGVTLEKFGTKVANVDCTVKGLMFGPSKNSQHSTIQQVIAESGKPIRDFGPLIDTFTKTIEIVALYGRLQKVQGQQLILGFKKQNIINMAIVSFIPAAIVMYYGGKACRIAYQKLRGTMNEDLVRNALVDIALLLNSCGNLHPSQMARQEYGRLMYLIEQLKELQAEVPYASRTSFMHDIQLLQSNALSADQKVKIIDCIYKRHPFLGNMRLA